MVINIPEKNVPLFASILQKRLFTLSIARSSYESITSAFLDSSYSSSLDSQKLSESREEQLRLFSEEKDLIESLLDILGYPKEMKY